MPFKTNGASPPQVDFELSDHGTVYLLCPLTRMAHARIKQHLPDDVVWFSSAVVEHCYIGPIIGGVIGDGLEVRGRGDAVRIHSAESLRRLRLHRRARPPHGTRTGCARTTRRYHP